MVSIAIDGPAGAGKSTIAKITSKKLGFIYVDTGALYRAIAYNSVLKNTDIANVASVEQLLSETKVELAFKDGTQIVILNGKDVSDKIRTPQISMQTSAISAIPIVREFLLDLQRDIAKENNIIMDGRDIGTVVLPNANIKIFLTASAECRAKRRYDELIEKGMEVSYDEILADIETRDYNDSHREIAPLKPAENGIIVDTSNEDLETSVAKLTSIIEKNL